MQEGLRVEAEEWLKTIITDQAIEAMRSYVATPFEERRQWVRDQEPGRSQAPQPAAEGRVGT